MHAGGWPDPRRDALATNFSSLDSHQSSASAECRMSASGKSIHQFQNTFLSRQPSRVVLVETQRCFGRSPQCFLITLDGSYSSYIRRTV